MRDRKRVTPSSRNGFVLSDEACCLREANLVDLRKLPVMRLALFVQGEKSSMRRVCRIKTVKGRELLADVVTGSLFFPETGICLGSPLLRLELPA